MVEHFANGLKILIIFPVDANGFASILSFHLIITFSLQDNTIWIEREIYDIAISLLSFAMRGNPRVAVNESSMWDFTLVNTGCMES